MVIVEKAIRYAPRGVVGVDIAGPRPGGARYDYTAISDHIETARAAGLGVTIHVGEEGGACGVAELREVIEVLRPDRIGHGILAAHDVDLMAGLREARIVLRDLPHLESAHEGAGGRGRRSRHVPGVRRERRPVHDRHRRPEMMRTHLRDEFELLLRIGALDRREAAAANQRGHAAAFGRPGLAAAAD